MDSFYIKPVYTINVSDNEIVEIVENISKTHIKLNTDGEYVSVPDCDEIVFDLHNSDSSEDRRFTEIISRFGICSSFIIGTDNRKQLFIKPFIFRKTSPFICDATEHEALRQFMFNCKMKMPNTHAIALCGSYSIICNLLSQMEDYIGENDVLHYCKDFNDFDDRILGELIVVSSNIPDEIDIKSAIKRGLSIVYVGDNKNFQKFQNVSKQIHVENKFTS